MKPLVDSLYLIVTRKDSRLVIILATIIFLLLLLLVQNGPSAFSLLGLDALPLARRIPLFLSSLFDITSTFTVSGFVLAIFGSLLGAINMSLAYTYMKIRGQIILKSGLYSGIGLLFAFFGVGCAACGTALVSVLISFFGLTAMLQVLPYQGQEIGYIGLLVLCIATYSLSRKVMAPAVC